MCLKRGESYFDLAFHVITHLQLLDTFSVKRTWQSQKYPVVMVKLSEAIQCDAFLDGKVCKGPATVPLNEHSAVAVIVQ